MSSVYGFPEFYCDKDETNITDIAAKMKVIEQSLNSFIQQNSEQMQKLTDTVAKASDRTVTVRPPTVIEETPGTKRRRTGDSDGLQGITPIIPEPRTTFVDVAKRNALNPNYRQQAVLQSHSQRQQQIQIFQKS